MEHHVRRCECAPPARKTAEKIKAAGGEIVYVAMDEPLWYGHYVREYTGCVLAAIEEGRKQTCTPSR